jgi:hypothetical protein
VHLWDLRCNNKPARTLNVGSETRVARNNFSKEIYCLDISGDFVVCGGGVELGLW